jgi:glyceraldehyde 3-phosphate dehydrogenase
MSYKIAINGFGRIGRLVLRALVESGRNDLEIVAINSPGAADIMAHLLEHDTTHGKFRGSVTLSGETLDFGQGPVPLFHERNPQDLPWGDLGVDIVLECSGHFNSRDKAAAHIDAGAKRVLISAPAKQADLTVVYGVNSHLLNQDHLVVSNASCTSNCLAPLAKVLNDSIGIESGFMTTVHAYTGDQNILDNSHKDLRRARAGARSLVPTSTGAAEAIGLVLPELQGRLSGSAIRVPTENVSLVDFSFVASRQTSRDEINNALTNAADGTLNGVLSTNNLPLVSIDFNHDPHSSIADLTQTDVLEGKLARVVAWYDNEWGFSMRMLDTAATMAKYL